MKKSYLIFVFIIFTLSAAEAQQEAPKIENQLISELPMERIRIVNRAVIDHFENNRLKAIDTLLEKTISFAQKHDDAFLLKEVKYQKLQSIAINAGFRKRIEVYRDIMKSPEFEGNDLYKGVCLHQIGQIYFVEKEYGQAFEYLLNAQDIFNSLGYENVANIGKYLHDLALDYYYFKNYEATIAVMKTSIKLPKFDNNLDIQRYNTLGMAYLKLHRPDSALHYLDKAYQKAENYNDKRWMGLISGNVGNVYFSKKELQKAFPYYQKDYALNKNTYRSLEIPLNACSNLAKFYIAVDSLEQAQRFIKLTEQYFPPRRKFTFGEQQQFEAGKRKYYDNQYRYHKKKRDYKKALLYRDSLVQVEKISNDTYNAALVKMTEDRLKIRENQNQIALQEKETIAMQLRYGTLTFLVSLLAVVGFTLYYTARLKRKKEKELWVRQRQINELERKNTRQALQNAQTALSNLTQKTRENQEVIARLQQERHTTKDDLIEDLKKKNILTTKDWEGFKDTFNKVYPEYIAQLKTLHSGLTQAELRCLCLAKLQLSNNEMALISGVSPNTILVTQHRLRKKLKVDSQDQVVQLIQEIC